MIKKIKQAANLISNMGMRYISFRVAFLLKKKTGLLKKSFPTNFSLLQFITLQEWRKLSIKFFFHSKKNIDFPAIQNEGLKKEAENILQGQFLFFSDVEYALDRDYDWITNPDTGFKYDINKHWTEINDYSKEAGDIKFVWEKSRFSFLYTLIRYDYHFKKDVSHFIFSEIGNWIDSNPVNMGPNYKCSQEMSLRILNWTFALQYYKNEEVLTEQLLSKILNSIYRQAQHVYSNINFSRIAVRNNHAITETLCLYLIGLLYPFFPESKKWKRDGKRWFEKEIAYQVYQDGTFLQFSMNYHRVVVQLLTWAFVLSKNNIESFSQIVYDRASASLDFLMACMNLPDGNLPNYGANDGALFFPLNNNDFRDYRPQLESLALVLGNAGFDISLEDKYWYGLRGNSGDNINSYVSKGMHGFKDGGYYILREDDSMLFIRCGNHKDRPSQADNLHVDIWVNGKNILRDSGSYKYNTDEETIRYFFGTASHNTVMLGDHDQMLKGKRFIWYNWSGNANATWKETKDYYEFDGQINAFKHVAPGIIHKRIVRKYKQDFMWEIIDEITSPLDLPATQIWNIAEGTENDIKINATEKSGLNSKPLYKAVWYSGKYGQKQRSGQILFTSANRYIHTIIKAERRL